MKVILSRKAFDSGAGGVANPILDDGAMIPLPIPDKKSPIRYRDVTIAGENLGAVAADLTRGKVRRDYGAHLDPDLIRSAYPRDPGWRPLFGQVDAAQSVLTREEIGPGDLFLFFGWFRRATRSADRLEFVRRAPDLHVIWGWLQIEEVIPVDNSSPPSWMSYHPHMVADAPWANNTLYVARETLALDGVTLAMPGAGGFSRYEDRLRLTKPGSSRSIWTLPSWFAPEPPRPPLGYHDNPERWRADGDRVELRSAARGQEFVLDTAWYPEALAWVSELLQVSRS